MFDFLSKIWEYFTGIFWPELRSGPSSNEDNGLQSVFVDNQIQMDCQVLWKSDKQRLAVGKHFQLSNPGEEHLFAYVKKTSLRKILPKHFEKVLSSYHSEVHASEIYDNGKKSQQFEFIDSILNTKVMKYVRNILMRDRKCANTEDFRRILWILWFKLYNGRCAFKHIFCGETDDASGKYEAVGLHNWIQYYIQERERNIHTGIMHRMDGNVVTTSFIWNGYYKKRDSFFVGTTPAFEIALYTYLYFVDPSNPHQKFHIKFDGNDVVIQVNRGDGNLRPLLLTAFPEIL